MKTTNSKTELHHHLSEECIDVNSDSYNTNEFSLSPKNLSKYLISIVFVLSLLHLIMKVLLHHGYSSGLITRLDQYFDLNQEKNFPTFFSSFLLMISSLFSILIYKISPRGMRDRRKWLILGFIFLFLALDEAIEIHERLVNVTRTIIANESLSFLYWAWIVPYTILTVAVGIYFFKFLLRLDKKTRNQIFLSGCVYFFAAVIIDAFEGHLLQTFDTSHIIFDVTIIAQEVLEMVGIIIFIRSLMEFLRINFKRVIWEFQ